MKIWSVKSTSLVESSVINLLNLHFINITCSYSFRHWASYIRIWCVSYICKIPKSWFSNRYLKKKKRLRKKKDLNWMENFKTESKYLKLCYEFRASRCMKAAFYRPDYQKFLMCPLIKRVDWAFLPKNAVESLKCSVELLKHSAELLKHLAELFSV